MLEFLRCSAVTLGALLWIASGLWLSWTDLRQRRLPARVIAPVRAALGGCVVVAVLMTGEWERAVSSAVGAAGSRVLYAGLRRLSRTVTGAAALGRGDVNYASLLGLVTGYCGWLVPLWAAGAAFLLGGLASLALLAAGRAGRQTRLPFGPFMFAGSVAAVLALG